MLLKKLFGRPDQIARTVSINSLRPGPRSLKSPK